MTESKIDLIVKAPNIAKAFGLKTRQVYRLHESGKAPIKNIPGLGLCASRRELEAYLYGRNSAPDIPDPRR